MSSAASIYLTLAWRNLWLNPWRTVLTAAALGIGIAALTFLSAMDDGWMQQSKQNFALTVMGHVQIHARGFQDERKLTRVIRHPDAIVSAIRAVKGVQVVAQRVRVSGLASSAEGHAGALIYAVQPEQEKCLSRLFHMLVKGEWLSSDGGRVALLGDGLAKHLKVGLGDKLVLMASVPGGEIVSEVFRVRGLIHSGVMDIDDMAVLVPLSQGQQWLGLQDAVTDLVIRVEHFNDVTPLSLRFQSMFSAQNVEVLRWFDMDPMAKQWTDFADVYTWIVLLIVIIVVLAEVLNTMLMSMHERVREFGLMGALGVQPWQVFVMVLWETVILVLIGGLCGFALGASLVLWYGEHGLDLSQFAVAFSFMYMDPVIHPMLKWESVLRILLASVLGALMAGVIPAWKASKLEPAQALREG